MAIFTEMIHIPDGRARINPSEAEALRLIAQAEQLTISGTVRWLIRREAAARSLWPPAAQPVREVRSE